MFSGYIPVKNGNLFYVFVPSENRNDPVVLWLNGGPGCTSMFGLLQENGPVRLQTQGTLTDNPYGWNTAAHMLFIDNPIGVGYSYTDTSLLNAPSTAMASAQDLLIALQQFLGSPNYFAEYQNNDLFAFGESYGGKYVIALAQAILDAQLYSKNNTNQQRINLKGIAIGNGWVSPDLQQRVYGSLGYSCGFLNYRNLVSINGQDKQCHALIEQDKYYDADRKDCMPLWLKTIRSGGGFNAYDYRVLGRYPFMTEMDNYMLDTQVMQALGVPLNRKPIGGTCNTQLFNQFLVEFQMDYTFLLPNLLKQMPVLVYNGQFDIRCSVMGTDEWLRVLKWDGRTGFNSLQHSVYYVNNVTSGIFRTHKNLTQVIIYGAGHMVPYDQPLSSLDMMIRFTRGLSFCSAMNTMEGQAPPFSCFKATCPNQCGGSMSHGNCNQVTGLCNCAPGYSGEDCSTGAFELDFGSTALNAAQSYIYGRSYHVYYLTLRNMPPLYTFKASLQKSSALGKAHIFLSLGNQFIAPNDSFVDILRSQYPYGNTEDVQSKLLEATTDRYSGNLATVVVYNNVDTDLTYSLSLWAEVPGTPVDAALVVSTVLFSGLSAVSIVLLVAALVQYILNSRLHARAGQAVTHVGETVSS